MYCLWGQSSKFAQWAWLHTDSTGTSSQSGCAWTKEVFPSKQFASIKLFPLRKNVCVEFAFFDEKYFIAILMMSTVEHFLQKGRKWVGWWNGHLLKEKEILPLESNGEESWNKNMETFWDVDEIVIDSGLHDQITPTIINHRIETCFYSVMLSSSSK